MKAIAIILASHLFCICAQAQSLAVSDADLATAMHLCREHIVVPPVQHYIVQNGQATLAPRREPQKYSWDAGWEQCGVLEKEQIARHHAAKSQEPQQQQSINDMAKKFVPAPQ